MAVQHKDLTGSALHEPKGADGASAGQVYVSDGAGSGDWTDLLATVNNANLVPLVTRIADISTAGSTFVACPFAGVVSKIYVTLQGAITVADSIVTAKVNSVPMTGLSITCAYSGSAAGSVFSGTPTALNTVGVGDAIEIITDGGSTTATAAEVTILVDVA